MRDIIPFPKNIEGTLKAIEELHSRQISHKNKKILAARNNFRVNIMGITLYENRKNAPEEKKYFPDEVHIGKVRAQLEKFLSILNPNEKSSLDTHISKIKTEKDIEEIIDLINSIIQSRPLIEKIQHSQGFREKTIRGDSTRLNSTEVSYFQYSPKNKTHIHTEYIHPFLGHSTTDKGDRTHIQENITDHFEYNQFGQYMQANFKDLILGFNGYLQYISDTNQLNK